MPFLIDTNILIYALAGNVAAPVLARIDNAIADRARYSVITRMELLGWSGHTAITRHETESLPAQLNQVNFTPALVATVIDIRSTISIKLPDAIIAASALTQNLPLMTRNATDFSRIIGLMVIDPFAA
ncbi:MAG: type II toxin-antitoxin system VapC family toxin [Rhodoferax sp.]|jgi:predicted nucleic acid-binding protein|uniref:type II toxin-antitoxin system VapC family toxin n=1 Tax=Rhodoferax sp. TaxID=50421 RepID=UPI003BAEEA4D